MVVIATLSAMMHCKNNIGCRSDKVSLGSGSFVGLILSSVKKAGGEKTFGREKTLGCYLNVSHNS